MHNPGPPAELRSGFLRWNLQGFDYSGLSVWAVHAHNLSKNLAWGLANIPEAKQEREERILGPATSSNIW